MTTSNYLNANFSTSSDVANKRDKNTMRAAFTEASAHNEKLEKEFNERFAQSGDIAERDRARKAKNAHAHTSLLAEMDDKSAAALLRYFNVEKLASAASDAYSLKKLVSVASVLNAGDWKAHSCGQISNMLAKLADEDTETRIDLKKFYAMFESKRQREMSVKMCERLGLLTRHKAGASYTEMTKHASKFWDKISAILES